ncbi:unnamed protein product [Pleuronectes platessa]|uniref:Uncharacterized protein n=1 Tax=Pleuronectes platessa TaxID=8262 RepID=A0A9N7ULU0_PLEPL|nr:unnamed protein product [Pleuronectes platessa]
MPAACAPSLRLRTAAYVCLCLPASGTHSARGSRPHTAEVVPSAGVMTDHCASPVTTTFSQLVTGALMKRGLHGPVTAKRSRESHLSGDHLSPQVTFPVSGGALTLGDGELEAVGEGAEKRPRARRDVAVLPWLEEDSE